MQHKIFGWILLVAIFRSVVVHGQHKDEIMSITQQQEDFSILRASLEEAHPGLYWFTSQAEMDHVFDSTYASLRQEISREDFWLILTRVVNKVHCLHTIVQGYRFYENEYLLPFQINILNGKTYIIEDLAMGGELEGAEILSIEGKPADEILDSIVQHVPHDGLTYGFALHLLRWQYRYYYQSIFNNKETITLDIQQKDQAPKTITVTGYSFEGWREQHAKQYSNAEEEVIQLRFIPESDAALLKLNRFDNWKSNGKKHRFRKVLKSKMKEIVAAGVKNLILDVGDEGGGNEKYGMQLLSYFIDEPYTTYRAIEFKTMKYKTAKKYSNTSWFEYHAIKTLLRFKKTDSTLLLKNYKGLKPTKPSPIHFDGDLYMLTSHGTASATSDFAAWVHHLKLATIIGQETGGGYVGNTSNWEFTITLPHSKARVRLPVARYFNQVDEGVFFGRGVQPDYLVAPGIEDLLSENDPQLNFVLDLIEKK